MKGKNIAASVWKTAVVAVLAFLLCFSQLLFSFDKLIADPLYQSSRRGDYRIRILAIDEKSIAAYGNPADWSREIPARLVTLLDEQDASAPALIVFDVMYGGERDAEADAAFAEACEKGGNVITAANLVYRLKMTARDGGFTMDPDNIERVEYPYDALRRVSSCGFANTLFDKDQFVRRALLFAEHDGETLYSLPAEAALRLSEISGESLSLPKTDSRGRFLFSYTGKNLGAGGPYEVLSLCDVLEGRIDPAVFSGCVVFVGAYAPGLQDSFNAAVQRGGQMYGVEIHANILQAILEGRTALNVPPALAALLTALITALYYLAIRRMKIGHAALLGAGVIAAYLALAKLLYDHGHALPVIELLLSVAAVYLVHLGAGYLLELLRKRRILNAFKKYVAPQVVEEVAAKGDFSIVLGGEKRSIAVLFVDIRGFTSLSESLQPEQVVEILNEYLSLTTRAIFANGGTLDKFVGDATMAVFNSPFDLDDYVYRAVCTARDIVAGSAELEKKLTERFGRSVGFGVGVNCGDAVVGNIGCDFRMDFTAIGDTVNTAARLESSAAGGQILISEAVYEAVRDRVRVTDMGELSFKGKSVKVHVYQLDEVM